MLGSRRTINAELNLIYVLPLVDRVHIIGREKYLEKFLRRHSRKRITFNTQISLSTIKHNIHIKLTQVLWLRHWAGAIADSNLEPKPSSFISALISHFFRPVSSLSSL